MNSNVAGRQRKIKRPGRPVEATTPEKIKQIHRNFMEDRRIKVREIAEIVGISVGAVHNILHEKLEMKKMCARRVPRLLNIDQKRPRKDISEQCLTMRKRNGQDFWHGFVTLDETWTQYYTLETKRQSKQCVAHGESAPKKAKTVSSAGKVTATVFWDAQRIILDHTTITDCGALWQLADKKSFFIKTTHWLTLPQSQWQNRMNQGSNICLIHPILLIWLLLTSFYSQTSRSGSGGKRFSSYVEIVTVVDEYFKGFESFYFPEGIKKIKERWTKCVEVEGDYVEK